MREGTPHEAGGRHPRLTPREKKRSGRITAPAPGVCRRTDALLAPSPRGPGVVPPQPRLTSPPLGVVGGRGAPEALPSLLPPLPPTPGRAATICGYSFTRQKKKKKFAECPTPKKKNPKPREKNLRVGLADGIIKASPEPRLALPLRQPPGEEPRPPARPPAPWTSEQVGARRPRPRPPPPPGSREIRFRRCPDPEPGRAGAGAAPACRARAGEARPAPSRGAGRGRGIPAVRSAGREVAASAAGSPASRRSGEPPPGAPARRGPGDPGGQSPAQKRGERVRGGERGCGGRGPGEEEGGRAGGGGARGRAGGRQRRPTPRAAPLSLPGRREGGREGGRARGERRAEGRAGRAGPRDLRLPRCAPRGRSPPCCPRPRSRRQVGAGGGAGGVREPRAGPPWPGSH